MKDGKSKEENLKNKEQVIITPAMMKKACSKNFDNKTNTYNCSSCRFEHICSIMQHNSYPRFWNVKKMALK
jgi:hypothetical protein